MQKTGFFITVVREVLQYQAIYRLPVTVKRKKQASPAPQTRPVQIGVNFSGIRRPEVIMFNGTGKSLKSGGCLTGSVSDKSGLAWLFL
ncbi:hypothetical protein RDV39_002801 [Salmonella enterica]|nr:hypothetical protein [Salmonella enterica]